MEIHIRIIGLLLMLLAAVHIIFPRYFHWAEELRSLSLMNRQMMYVHTFFIALVVFLMGILCFVSADDLLSTQLGNRIAIGMAVFWTCRLIIQFFGYSSQLWKGKPFETTVHIIFSLLWMYFSAVFIVVSIN